MAAKQCMVWNWCGAQPSRCVEGWEALMGRHKADLRNRCIDEPPLFMAWMKMNLYSVETAHWPRYDLHTEHVPCIGLVVLDSSRTLPR